jgi:AcrR family transcriptional regulator
MSRPSTQVKERLIAAGRELVVEQGLSGLRLRAVAERAKVNLGMFQYHFKGKEDFTAQVMQSCYDGFFSGFAVDTAEKDPVEALRAGFFSLGLFMRDHRRLVFTMLMDAYQGQAEPRQFIFKNFPRHGRILAGLIRKGQSQGRLRKMGVPSAMAFVMGAVGGPNLMATVAEKAVKGPLSLLVLPVLRGQILSDKAIALRVDCAIRGLQVEVNGRKA